MADSASEAGDAETEQAEVVAGEAYVISNDCISCAICEYMCPTGAIVETRNQFSILKRLCDGCGDCAQFCPVRAIVPKGQIRDRQDNNVATNLRRVLDIED
ncbi:MAG: 4Fe-4S binding protein [Pseudomonadales bacterium]|jgi:MinD superfamily P-loop ATPase|nr:4Fe-4S binding protein [Pseudomonadales bacterium]MDP6469660.1 4Fe-4S binding protein [Pseudomonadales bacterium]MDP6828901.1 4Fe-4S binding protein [Pseudomonadales bacterium]|tara:strand:+ start:2969 stop:3271 length:303 start_codon:yes stop_codon:yes gene_type:complete